MSKLSPGIKQFIVKTVIFSILFIAVTGIIGSTIIPTKLLYGYHFFIYGNIGKLILFSVLIFLIFTKDTIKSIKAFTYSKKNLLVVIAALLGVPLFLYLSSLLLKTEKFTDNLFLSLGLHTLGIGIVVALTLGVFSLPFLRYFISKYRKEIGYCIGISIVYYFAIFQVWKLWPYFSGVVLDIVKFLLSLSFSPVIEIPPHTLFVKDFSVAIAEACSGVDSLFLFTTLYLLIGIVERKNVNIQKLIILFIPAILGLFLMNVLRVYILLLIGIFLSPAIMMDLFHTYIGMIFFLVYFALFWKQTYSLIHVK